MSGYSERFIDEYNNIHIPDKLLGKGGQGIVLRTKDPDIAVKLVITDEGQTVSEDKLFVYYNQLFARLRRTPLPDKINIALPVALLRDNAGYVMQLLNEMIPFSSFWFCEKSEGEINSSPIPDWLQGAPEPFVKKLLHYRDTGGLKRRLMALYKCACILTRLHSAGLVYCDISPNNVFISESSDYTEVWLIDPDNIRFEVSGKGPSVYTPQFGAPEIVNGSDGCRFSSDCYSFSVLAFYLLSLVHPFIGQKADGTDEDDWADDANDEMDAEAKAYAGLYPWVDDPDDDSNRTKNGLQRVLLLTESLRLLFEKTFGPGKSSPPLRPTMYHWSVELAKAADKTIQCPNCRMSYYFDSVLPRNQEPGCPYCRTRRPKLFMIESFCWNGAQETAGPLFWQFVSEFTGSNELAVPLRVLGNFTMQDSDTIAFTLKFSSTEMLIRRNTERDFLLSVAIGSEMENAFQQIHSQFTLKHDSSDLTLWLFSRGHQSTLLRCKIM